MVDASVLAAAVFGESRADQAASLLRDRSLIAPGLLWYEMSEVARVKCRLRPSESEMILEQLREARRFPIVLHVPDWDSMAQLAFESGLTAYDASYLQLAKSLGAVLVTFDGLLHETARRSGVYSQST